MKIMTLSGRLNAQMRLEAKPLSIDEPLPPRLVADIDQDRGGYANLLGQLQETLLALHGERVRITVEKLDGPAPVDGYGGFS